MGAVQIYGPYGQPISRQEINRVRMHGLINGGSSPFDSADMYSPEMMGWEPWLGSPDTEITPYRDRSVARQRDIIRNDGWAAGGITRLVDNIVGAEFRLSARPDYRGLARRFGPAFDASWAKDFAEAAEAGFRSWANDPGHWCDTARQQSFSEMARLGCRHYLAEGEALGVLPWRQDRRSYGRARYATTMQVVDPDRLSNPNMRMDTRLMRGGIEMDEDGVTIAYHIRKAHMNDWFDPQDANQWERIEREEWWGRPKVMHHFDAERAGQHRPVGGIFTPVLARMRMLAQYDRLELQAAIVNATFAAYIKSPMDPEDIEASMADSDKFSAYQRDRGQFHAAKRIMAGNVELTTLYPGEELDVIASNRPSSAFDAFQGACLRSIASALNVSYETLSGDFRGSSYSSARQALLTEWKTINRRRIDFGGGFCTPVYVALLEEMIDRGELPLPKSGAPDFAEARAEYARCKWIGPGRGWIDPTREPDGSKTKIAAGLSTLERECEDDDGSDWTENIDQQSLEQAYAAEKGVRLVHDTAVAQQDIAAGTEPAKQGESASA